MITTSLSMSIDSLYIEGISAAKIAKSLNLNYQEILNYIKQANLKRKKKEFLEKQIFQYLQEGKKISKKELRQKLGMAQIPFDQFCSEIGFNFNELKTKERVEAIKRLAANGLSRKEIALKLDLSVSLVFLLCKKNHISLPHKKWYVDRQKIRDVVDDITLTSLSYAEIGTKYGLSRQRISQIAIQQGISRRKLRRN